MKLDTEMKLLFGAIGLWGLVWAFKGSKFDKVERKLSAGKDYLITYSIQPPLKTTEALAAFKKALIDTGATSVDARMDGGTYIVNPKKDDRFILHAVLFKANVQGFETSVIVDDVKEV